MFKNIQFKFILIFLLIGILVIGGFGAFFITSLNEISSQIQSNDITQLGQVLDKLTVLEYNTKVILIISSTVFIIVAILIAIFLSKFVIYPINKLIKSLE